MRLFRFLPLGVFLLSLSVPLGLALYEGSPDYDTSIDIMPSITINGEEFILDDVPHDQADTLGWVNIPIRLGDFTAPITLELDNLTDNINYAKWEVEDCYHDEDGAYYIEPDNFETIERDEDDIVTDPGGFDFYHDDTVAVSLELSEPNCYEIFFRGYEEYEGNYMSEDDIYFMVTSPDGYIEPSFSMEFEHSDLSIFSIERYFALPPEVITLTDTSDHEGEVATASREWTIEWGDIQYGTSSHGNAFLPISTTQSDDEVLYYDFTNPGRYKITLEVTGTNGLTYETSQEHVFLQTADVYFSAVLSERYDGADFGDFYDTVESIDDEDLYDLYIASLEGCEFEVVDGGGSMVCDEDVEATHEEYNENLEYLYVPCTVFTDLNDLYSSDELCRAADRVKEIEAFQGDGEGSATEGYLRPEDDINRIEMCAVLNRSQVSTSQGTRIGIPESIGSSDYSDLTGLDDTDWRKRNAVACVEFDGNPDGTFGYANNINLVEALKVLFGIYEVDVDDDDAAMLNNYCSDLSEDAWYAKYLSLAHQVGLLDDLNDISDPCDAGQSLSRKDVIVLMYRMYFEYVYIGQP
ncbi:hypothetical protein HN748_06350 [Candidatus Peregrinibacteria bacterium]|jgi:hypothetical protein|nr:hypothetical protein [Candidatus Peregrinibacteria bacterium]MBT7484516.1 hypothetical protein [Candidatus Peregrinibacteria bacterium]MBT7703824.1 hypothetical protein [Candidatus Peregrinibacteria bacterium]